MMCKYSDKFFVYKSHLFSVHLDDNKTPSTLPDFIPKTTTADTCFVHTPPIETAQNSDEEQSKDGGINDETSQLQTMVGILYPICHIVYLSCLNVF